jgi:LDH2 family malate/lactate/ureidoglycolate dehydrogenase
MVSNGVLFTVYNIAHFTDLDTYYDEVESLVRHVKSSRLAPGFTEILAPGEPEFRSAAQKEIEGINIDETSWAAICEEGRALGLDPGRWET